MSPDALAPRFLKLCLLSGSALIAVALASSWLWPHVSSEAHALQNARSVSAQDSQEVYKKKKKRKRKTKRKGGRRGGLGGDFEGGGGSYHTNGPDIGPERLAAP